MTLRLSALQSVLGGLLVALAFLVDPALGHAAVAAAAIAAVRQGTRGLPPAHRRPWQLLAGVQVVWACSDALGTQPAGAALRLTGYLAAAAALAAIVHQRRGGYDVVDSLDNLAVGAALALLWWAVFARPALEADIPLLRIALPAAAAVVAAMVVRLVLQTPARPAALTILLAGLACLVAADSATTVLDQWADPSAGAIGVARLAFGLACAAAVLHPSLTVLVAERLPRTELSRGRIVALGLALPTGPAIVAVHALAGDTADMGLLVAGSAVVIGLVLARLVVTVRRLVATHRERDALEQQLLHQARHDVLTGLPNRAAALRATESALHRARRTGVVVALLFIDLDGFKAVNDLLGHAAGDALLREIGLRLRRTIRETDVLGRFGGDEFIAVAAVDSVDGAALADRIRAAVAEPYDELPPGLPITASI
ncbi:MAG: diguanylate cyclase domain-containing protein, partial [Jatrophihabitans sp.]|uniref:diguanylate cyclase domain-containing protein n=1 Tax=Jatrophihabitans sp. TaxID=1932789 RepID=UPI003F7FEF3E